MEFGVGGDLVMFPGRCDTGSLSPDKSKHGEDAEQARRKKCSPGEKITNKSYSQFPAGSNIEGIVLLRPTDDPETVAMENLGREDGGWRCD